MRKDIVMAVVFTAIGLFSGINQASADGETGLTIESVVVNKVTPTGCDIRWQAVIRNNGVVATSVSGIGLNAAQGMAGEQWWGAGGTLLGSIAPGASITKSMTFERQAKANQFRVQIAVQGVVVAEKIEVLPIDPVASAEVSNCTITDTGYVATIHNLGPAGVCGISVQGHAASSSNPNNWTPTGGMVVPCLNGNGSYQRNWHKPSGYDIMKITLTYEGAVLNEKVFNFAVPNKADSGLSSGTKKSISANRRLRK